MSQIMLTDQFEIVAGNFTNAGQASATIKRKLKQLGIPADVLKRVAIASYEVELNLVIHSMGGTLTFEVSPVEVRLVSKDIGPGIADINKAMTEGFSTANEEAQSMGFGAGMGLPNMKRNADRFDIQSRLGVGTTIDMVFLISGRGETV